MGNRAVVTSKDDSDVGIYLHWNGGIESVLAFAHCARDLGIRNPVNDPDYFRSRFAQMVGNFFGDTTSLGVGKTHSMDCSDNGIFYLDEKFEIFRSSHKHSRKDLTSFLKDEKEYYRRVYNDCMKKNYKVFGVKKHFIKKSEMK